MVRALFLRHDVPLHQCGLSDLGSWPTSYSCFSGFPLSYSLVYLQHLAPEMVTGLLGDSHQVVVLVPSSLNLRCSASHCHPKCESHPS